MARLYEDIRITLPLDRGLVCVLEPLIKTKANGLRFTKRLSIMCDYNQGVGYLSDADFEEFADDGGMSPFSGRYNDMVVTLNVLVRTILEKIPNDQLSSFRYVTSLICSPYSDWSMNLQTLVTCKSLTRVAEQVVP